jgi:hypothetical protein
VRRRLGAHERLENPLAILCLDTQLFILHRELQFGLLDDPSRDTDWCAWWRISDRVVDEVGEHALHLIGVQLN